MKKRTVKPDILLYATGYTQKFEWLDDGYPRGPDQVDTLEMVDSSDMTLSWIGHVRPGVGAIPPIAEEQAMLWALLLQKRVPLPKDEGHYRLLARKTARIQYGVDHSTYSYALADAMGAAPSLSQLYFQYGLRMLLIYCFGAAFTPFYRLVGPYKSAATVPIIEGELLDVIMRRGVIGNLTMGLIPMIFYGLVSGVALFVEIVWRALKVAGIDMPLPKAIHGKAGVFGSM